jgi:hypothetical protein
MSRNKGNKITIYDYIAERVPSDAHFLINKYGKYRKARDSRELSYQLKDFIRTFGEKGLNELAQIHPDKHLLQVNCDSCEKNKRLLEEEKKSYFNAQRMFGFNAKGGNENNQKDNTEKVVGRVNANMLVMAGFVLMGVALIVKTK